MDDQVEDSGLRGQQMITRLDRLPRWPYLLVVLWVIGAGYFIAFFDITNVAFGFSAGAVLASFIGDTFERKFIIQAGMAIWTVCFVSIGLAASPILIYGCVFLLAAFLGFYIPLLYTLSAESFPTRSRATGVLLTDGAGHLGGALGPILAMAIYFSFPEQSGFKAVFLCMALTGLLTICLLSFTVRTTRRSLAVVTR